MSRSRRVTSPQPYNLHRCRSFFRRRQRRWRRYHQHGTQITLTAFTNAPYSFVDWTSNVNGVVVGTSPALSITVTTNATFIANFSIGTATNHIVVTSTPPPGLATVTGAGNYANGLPVQFSAPRFVTNGTSYYVFSGFILDGSPAAGNPLQTSFLPSDPTNATVVANYAVTS